MYRYGDGMMAHPSQITDPAYTVSDEPFSMIDNFSDGVDVTRFFENIVTYFPKDWDDPMQDLGGQESGGL